MCKAPDPPKPQPAEKPEFLHNEYLDAAIGQSATVAGLRSGRSSLRIPLGSGIQVKSAANAPPPPGRPAAPTAPGPNMGPRGGARLDPLSNPRNRR